MISHCLSSIYEVKSYFIILVHVDDIITTGDEYNGTEYLKFELSHCFAMKDLGVLHYFLVIEVACSSKGYLLSQSKYLYDLFDRACLLTIELW